MEKDLNYYIHLGVIGKQEVYYSRDAIREVGKELGVIPDKVGRVRSSFKSWAAVSTMVNNSYNAIKSLTDQMNEYIQKSNAVTESQTKLKTIMQQRMSATDQDISSINNLIKKQTELGVIGGTVQRSGMQQLATFASQKQTLETLLPAMDNLLVQQNGLNSTSENAVSIANLMGKALMGNYSALKRVGITLTESQIQMIKNGDEGERAQAIAEAITQNVGEMNKKMAETDAGKAKQAANSFAALQTSIGAALAPFQTFITQFGQIGFAVTGATQLFTAIKALGTALGVNTAIARMHAASMLTMQLAMGGASTASTILAYSLTALKVAIRGVLIATGVGIVITALSTAFDALTSSTNNSTSALNGNTEAEANNAAAAQRAAQRQKEAHDAVSQAASNTKAKFESLQVQWNSLKTEAEKTAWIKKNQSAFAELGIKVNNVNDAYSVFVKNAPKVIQALQAIAEAEAYKGIYQKAVQDKYDWDHRKGSRATGDYRTTVNGNTETKNIPMADQQAAGLGVGDYIEKGFKVFFTGSGLKKINDYYNQQANNLRNSKQQEVDKELSDAKNAYAQSLKKGAEAQNTLNNLGGTSLPQVNTTSSGGRTTRAGNTRSSNTSRSGSSSSSTVDKPLTLIKNPSSQPEYENNSRYYQQEIYKLDANNPNDKVKIENLLKEKAAVDELLQSYENLDKEKKDSSKEVETPKYEKGSAADIQAQIQDVDSQLNNKSLQPVERAEAMIKKDELEQQLADITMTVKPEMDWSAVEDGLKSEISRLMKTFQDTKIDIGIRANTFDNIQKVSKEFHKVDQQRKKQTKDNKKEAKDDGSQDTISNLNSISAAAQSMGDAFSKMGASSVAATLQVVSAMASATAEIIPQIMALIGAKEGEALASGTASGAKLPFPANVAAIATIVASVMGVIATIASVAGSYATGGIVPGNSYSGDKLTAHVNSGEMILNAKQQSRLFAIASGSLAPSMPYISSGQSPRVTVNTQSVEGGGMQQAGRVVFKVKGRELYGVLESDGRLSSKTGKRYRLSNS